MLPRGPKGWVRPDESILDELCARLGRSLDARELGVEVERGVVHLDGAVRTLEDRELVMTIAAETLGVSEVHADLRVFEQEEQPDPYTLH